jgi:hypothetical protein
MNKIIKKLNTTTALIAVVCLVSSISGVNYVLAASNDASQVASTTASTSISVVAKTADTEITTITFPEGAPSATVTTPYNDVDTVSDAQVLDGSASEPVVRLKNTSGGTLTVTLEITQWTNSAVVAEYYELVDPATVNITAVSQSLSADGDAASVNTATTVASSAYGALYLGIDLAALSGVSGTSTLSILGES